MSDLPSVGPASFRSAEAARRFCLAGNARVTVVSKRTEARYTFRISAPREDGSFKLDDPKRFVSLLTGSDNESDFTYLGMIPQADDPAFRATKGSRLPTTSARKRRAEGFGSTTGRIS